MNFTPEMRARRAFPLGPRRADLKTATSAVSTLIRGLYSNDFTLLMSLKKQYAPPTPIGFSSLDAEYPQFAQKTDLKNKNKVLIFVFAVGACQSWPVGEVKYADGAPFGKG